MNTCKLCKFWHKDRGQCRRYPPNGSYIDGGKLFGTWPSSDENDYCGEFQVSQILTAEKAQAKPTRASNKNKK